MADKVSEKTAEPTKEKIVTEEKKEEETKEAVEKENNVDGEENGDLEEAPKNGREDVDSKDAVDAKEDEEEEDEEPVSCPVKRKSTTGSSGDAPEGSEVEDSATPEKKAKLNSAESNEKSEVTA